MNPLSKEELKELKEKAEKAHAGPWKVYKEHFTLTEIGRARGFTEDRETTVNAIGQAWDHPQLHGPLPIVTTQHGPYYDPQHAVKIEDRDAEYIATADPSTVLRLIEMVEKLQEENIQLRLRWTATD